MNRKVKLEEFHVIGPPGCGKTTWLKSRVQAAVKEGQHVLVTSLTRAAAAEVASGTLPVPRKNIGTLHSHCFRALANPEIAQCKRHLSEWNDLHPLFQMTPVDIGLDDAIHNNSLQSAGHLPGDRFMSEYEKHRARLTKANMPPVLNHFAHCWEHWKDERGLMDFTDLIENCLNYVPSAPGFPDVIFVDEAQDHDLLEMSLIRKWGADSGRLFMVGDPDQAIYTWRGADPRAFAEPTIPPENRHILSQSYRVPVAVHAKAVQWINQISNIARGGYQPRCAEGEMRRIRCTWQTPDAVIDDMRGYLAEGMTVMAIATCNYLLRPMIKSLQLQGIPFHNTYRMRQFEWNPLTKPKVREIVQQIVDFFGLSRRGYWTGRELNNVLGALTPETVLREGGATIAESIAADSKVRVSQELVGAILSDDAIEAGYKADLNWFHNQLLPNKVAAADYPLAIANNAGLKGLTHQPRLTVGTIHSVKGGEADWVYVFPDLSRSGTKAWRGDYLGRAEICRTFYVGMTRAREGLILPAPAAHFHVNV